MDPFWPQSYKEYNNNSNRREEEETAITKAENYTTTWHQVKNKRGEKQSKATSPSIVENKLHKDGLDNNQCNILKTKHSKGEEKDKFPHQKKQI